MSGLQFHLPSPSSKLKNTDRVKALRVLLTHLSSLPEAHATRVSMQLYRGMVLPAKNHCWSFLGRCLPSPRRNARISRMFSDGTILHTSSHSTATCLLLCNEHHLTSVLSLHAASPTMAHSNRGSLHIRLEPEISFSKPEINSVLLLEQKEYVRFGSLHFNDTVL